MTTTAITVRPLSGSTDGRGIKVAATSTPGTLVHTAQASATDMDVPELQAYNSHTADVTVTFECGGVSAPDDHVKRTIPAGETIGVPLPALRNGLVLRAFASVTNVIVITGAPGVKRITVT